MRNENLLADQKNVNNLLCLMMQFYFSDFENCVMCIIY